MAASADRGSTDRDPSACEGQPAQMRPRDPQQLGRMLWFRLSFKNRWLECMRDAFQELFAQIMERAHPGDFRRIRPSPGDHGCDGFLSKTGTVFQVYAPRRMERGDLHTKIKGDFEKARQFFGDQMKQWIFVHNDPDGFAADTLKLLNGLPAQNSGIATSSWAFEALWKEVQKLSHEALVELFPPSPEVQISAPDVIPTAGEPVTPVEDALRTEAASGTGISAPGDSTLRSRVLAEQVDAQAGAIRKHLDKEGKRLWDDIKRNLAALDYTKAIASGGEFRQWLTAEGAQASSGVRGRAYLLLAELALIEAAENAPRERVDTAQSRADYELARDSFAVDITEEDSERLIVVAAKLDAAEGEYAKALERLEGIDSPRVMSLRLAILIDQQDFQKAAALLHDRTLHERWVHSAVVVYVATNEQGQASKVLNWARDEEITVFHRCLLAYARTVSTCIEEDLQKRDMMMPGQVQAAERDRLEQALAKLHPILCDPEKTGKVHNGAEAEGLAVAIMLSYRLGNLDECQTYCELLGQYSPVSLVYARAVQEGIVEPHSDLPERVRRDHPLSQDALLLAAAIEGIRLGKVAEAVAETRGLIAQTQSGDHKERLGELLEEVSAALPSEEQAKLAGFLETQFGADHCLVRQRRVIELLLQNETKEAEALLETLHDEGDPVWWQLLAKLRYKQDRKPEAAEAQAKASRMLQRVETQRSAAALAEEAERWDLLEDALKRVLALAPQDHRARVRLGALYVDQHRFADAASCFEHLWKQQPEESTHALNLATCLRNDGRTTESLEVLEQLCAKSPPVLHAILGRAQLFREDGKPDRAFQSLQTFRGSFWNHEDFLLAYVGFGYSAARDDAANEAFAHLLELQREGKVSPDKLWSASLDDTIELIKSQNRTLQSANDAVLRGRLPWLAVESLRRHPPYLAWRFRTQPLNVSDNTQARATRAIYATNRFTVHANEEHDPTLEHINCPPRGAAIVMDLTALLTLHRLGLLDKTVDYFGTLHVPATYIPTMLEDAAKLAPHQPSGLQATESIKRAVDEGSIQILSDAPGTKNSRLASVTEYDDEEANRPPSYHLIDFFGWLHSSGQLSKTEYDRARQLAHKPPRTDTRPLDDLIKNGIVIDLDTLKTVCDVGLLQIVLQSTAVHISEEEASHVRHELGSAVNREEVLGWHKELAATLKDETRFRRAGVPTSQVDIGREENLWRDQPVAALLFALDRTLPLFVDDRCCQAVAQNANKQDTTAAFGTDAFLVALLDEGMISLAEGAQHFRQLMAWRYRFLLPPARILSHWACEYSAHPPGAPLVETSQYAHDCMRDPGLFGGSEPTRPPLPLAFHFWYAWIGRIGEFLMDLWLDPTVDESVADAITRWCVNELLPTPPRNLQPFVRSKAAAGTPQILLTSLLAQSLRADDEDAANRAVWAAKESLGVSDVEYLRVIGEISSAWPKPGF